MKRTRTARLHVILAREASLAIVIRRGRAKQVCTVLWNHHTDKPTIELCQRAPEAFRI
jgi:hypothetical protein